MARLCVCCSFLFSLSHHAPHQDLDEHEVGGGEVDKVRVPPVLHLWSNANAERDGRAGGGGVIVTSEKVLRGFVVHLFIKHMSLLLVYSSTSMCG